MAGRVAPFCLGGSSFNYLLPHQYMQRVVRLAKPAVPHASSASLSKLDQGKSIIACDDFPHKEIAFNSHHPPFVPAPIIDISLLSSMCSKEEEAEHEKLKLALTSWGCFQLIEVVKEYSAIMKSKSRFLLKAMARSLNLEDDCFLKQYKDEELIGVRFNYYPAATSGSSDRSGCKPHSDGSGITILLQDKLVEGLQILKDGQWYIVPTIPDALLVNVGDQMQIISNGIFKSPMHRVIVESKKERVSVAVFHLPKYEVEIGPVQCLIDENRPQQYRNLKNYRGFYYDSLFQGKSPLEMVKANASLHSNQPIIIMSKYVQEMSIDGDEPHARYIIKDILNPSPPSVSIPVIDLSLLSSLSSKGAEELDKLKEALSSWGCFQMKQIVELLLKATARSLDLEEDCFLKQYEGHEHMAARFNYYPKCPRPDSVLGVKAHSDGSAITILLQDKDVEGLQIFKDDQWFRVPIIPHAFVVNAGDQMQIMSNGIFKSPMHRVSTKVEIEPVKGLIDEERPQQYRKLKNYAAINFECFQSGKVALETVKI
ncbi:conserved hypothetical protein [Ricinus communis]|uniref:Fe2OG dioxygenase domain-containing protein n=1 Tax=Ricinus communis TaxID=3988 RepID=B9T5Z7_RICCO|nr:conserved hypothetical protein [Ricinus communis]